MTGRSAPKLILSAIVVRQGKPIAAHPKPLILVMWCHIHWKRNLRRVVQHMHPRARMLNILWGGEYWVEQDLSGKSVSTLIVYFILLNRRAAND